ncbi:MAG: sensor histidine kinase, partial [Myxococcales bacterium]|nr:sensor histidine kinase [Myxococcales bacterium]
ALVWFLAIGAVGNAEREIRELLRERDEIRKSVERANQELESQVEMRTEELSSAVGELQQSRDRLTALAARTVSLQESERRSIGRDLHDGTGQALTAVQLGLEMLEALSANDPSIRENVHRTQELTLGALEEVRRAVQRLGPPLLDELEFRDAVERMGSDIADQAGFELDLSIAIDGVTLSPAVEIACYRIAQEALTNIAKHSPADKVSLSMRVEHARLELFISDNGGGSAILPENPTSGLRGMRERCAILGGRLDVRVTEGGVAVTATIPLLV